MAKSNVTFEVTESFLEMTESRQDQAVKAFVAANPKSVIVLTGEAGSVPPYLRRQVGKRFEICSALGGSEFGMYLRRWLVDIVGRQSFTVNRLSPCALLDSSQCVNSASALIGGGFFLVVLSLVASSFRSLRSDPS